MKTGLTVGKFAPFHKGHSYLIESAYKYVEHMVIIVYDAPSQTDIPLNVRANWLRTLYPEARVIEGWDVPTDKGWTQAIHQKHVNFILSLVDGLTIDAFFSSESYGEIMSTALNCKNIVVDIDRNAISISGTDIRNDAFAFRSFLDPVVYKDFITTVAIFEPSKKNITNLASMLADAFHTIYVPDNEDILLSIAIQEAHKYLFIGKKLESQICQNVLDYDLLFIGGAMNDANRHRIIGTLKTLKIPYFLLNGTFDEQIIQVKSVLSRYKKFMNPMDLTLI